MKKLVLVVLTFLIFDKIFAANIEVTSNADSGAGSLRAALTVPGVGDTIVFSLGSSIRTIKIGRAHV